MEQSTAHLLETKQDTVAASEMSGIAKQNTVAASKIIATAKQPVP